MKELFKYQQEKYKTTYYMDHTNLDDPRIESFYRNKKKPKKVLLFTPRNTYESESQFIINFGNRICEVDKRYMMVVVEANEKKVSMKLFLGFKSRYVGNTWFKTYKRLVFLTFDKIKGDYYYGEMINYHKKKSFQKKFNKNCHFRNPIVEISNLIKHNLDQFGENNMFELIMYEVTNSFFKEISENLSEKTLKKDLQLKNKDQLLLLYHLEYKKVKYPDNFFLFYGKYEYKLPLKFLKKNNMRLTDAFMQKFKLKGKNVKKALHTTNKLNLNMLILSYDIFGEERINRDYNLILDILNSIINYDYFNIYFGEYTSKMSKKEIENTFTFFSNCFLRNEIEFHTFIDHFRMYNELKDYGELSIKWNSTNKLIFVEEHLDWSDKLEYYKRGTYFRLYPETLIEEVSKPIQIDGKIYTPVVLTTSHEYNNESYIQSNCVKTYMGRPGSFIVSLREYTESFEERATIEYLFTKNMKISKVRCERIQFLGKFNKRLEEKWNEVLLKLDNRLLSYIDKEDFETIKIKKICSNGQELFSDSYWNEEGHLKWSYKSI